MPLVINWSMLLQSSGTRCDQARQLIRDLETRGSRAFPLFLECLRETGHHTLVELLQNGAPAVRIQPPTPVPVDRPVIRPLPVCKCVIGSHERSDDNESHVVTHPPPV